MRLLFEETSSAPATVILLSKAENNALLGIVDGYLKTKPNKRSAAYKLAKRFDTELLA